MIGTRHEKAVIVLTSYVIGFTTAFIAFGISNMGHKGDMHQNYKQKGEHHQKIDYKKEHQNISAIGSDDEGLFVTVAGYNRTISATLTDLEASVIEALEGPGYAFAHHGALVSNDGWFAFYCEQSKEDDTTCLPFVYGLYDDTVHRVTLDNNQQPLSFETMVVTWSEDNHLVINGNNSDNAETPWKFYTPSSEVVEVVEEANEIREPADTIEVTDVEIVTEAANDESATDAELQVQ